MFDDDVRHMLANMTAIGVTKSSCPAPFINAIDYPPNKGNFRDRTCLAITAGSSCCLPCPLLDWFYPKTFYKLTRIPGYIATATLVLTLFMLFSWAVLPAAKTKRHYLNVSLVVSIVLIELGIVIPTWRRPQRCADPITAHDQDSSLTCAWSGTFLIFGVAAMDMWILIRALTMHLLIVWDISLPKHAFLTSQLLGWGIPGILLTTGLTLTGVSCRLGDVCPPNLPRSWGTLWGPVLALTGITTVLTALTAGYCFFIYIKSVFTSRNTNGRNTGDNAPTTPRNTTLAVWRRTQAVIRIQWRPIAITAILLLDLITIVTVFNVANAITVKARNDPDEYRQWVLCLILEGQENKDKCLRFLPHETPTEATVVAPLFLLAITGFLAFLLLSTSGMVTGWWDLIRGKPNSIGTMPAIDTTRLRAKMTRRKSERVKKADISLPKLPRFSTPGKQPPASELASVKIATSGKTLKMGGRPLGPVPANDGPREMTSATPLNSGVENMSRYSQSLHIETTGMSTAQEAAPRQTPQKRGNATPARVSIADWDPAASVGSGNGVGPLSFHPVEREDEHEDEHEHEHEHGHEHGHEHEHHQQEEEESDREDSLFYETPSHAQTPGKHV